jgi:hypothetical protein
VRNGNFISPLTGLVFFSFGLIKNNKFFSCLFLCRSKTFNTIVSWSELVIPSLLTQLHLYRRLESSSMPSYAAAVVAFAQLGLVCGQAVIISAQAEGDNSVSKGLQGKRRPVFRFKRTWTTPCNEG